MVTLANFDGRSLALDLDAAFSPALKQKYVERKADEREQQDIELLRTAQGLAPAVEVQNGPDKKSQGFLRRIAPGLADQLDKMNQDRNPDAVDELRKEAALNVETAARIRKATSPAEKQRIILERAGEFQKQGRDNRQLLKMSGMTLAEIDLQAQKAEMMGNATLKSLPPPTEAERLAARAQLAVRNPQAYAALMQDEAVKRQEEAQRAAQARAGAAQARKDANERARMEALQGYLSPQTEQVAPMGPTIDAANAGATSGQDLAALQTRQVGPQVTQDTLMQAIMDPRLSNDDRSRLEKIYEMQNPAGPEPTAAMQGRDEQVQEYQDLYNVDVGTATAMADGLLRPVPDGLGGVSVVDMRDVVGGGGQAPVVQGNDPPTPAGTPPAADTSGVGALPTTGVDYAGALGLSGDIKSVVNSVGDYIMGTRAFEEVGKARTGLQNLRTRTLTTLATAGVVGRPSNYVMEMFNQNVVQPGLMSGPTGARDTAQQTLDFIRAMEAENRAVLQSKVDKAMKAQAARNIEALAGLAKDYETVLDGMKSGKNAGNKTSSGVSWEFVD